MNASTTVLFYSFGDFSMELAHPKLEDMAAGCWLLWDNLMKNTGENCHTRPLRITSILVQDLLLNTNSSGYLYKSITIPLSTRIMCV